MIPRNLPALMKTALLNGWDVHAIQADHRDRSSGLSCHRGETVVYLVWLPDGPGGAGRLWKSSINGQPTPYKQCVALLRSKEN